MNLASKYEEGIVFALRSLYSKYGYSQYKMNKFEEYDLYVRNKDFLISDSVITFTDTNGKLMALKPDVTLSIVKNSKDVSGYVEKLYYNENVYRVSKSSKSFKEIMQVGLECIGDIDSYSVAEVISLAAKSLCEISQSSVLCLSHMDILSALLDAAGIPLDLRDDIIKCIEEKNSHELKRLCDNEDIGYDACELVGELVSLYGKAEDVIPKLRALCDTEKYTKAVDGFEQVISLVDDSVKNMLIIDFSVVSDTKYYNGILFKGFAEGISGSLLSGGQYDSLMQRMQKKSGAIGFAVYLDMLDPLKTDDGQFEQDIIILYDDKTDMQALKKLTEELIEKGNRVSAQRSIPQRLTYKQLIRLNNGEVETVEENA